MENEKKDPWTDPDPQPGDFDGEIERATPDQFGGVIFDPDLEIRLVSDEEAERRGLVNQPKPARR